MESAKETAKRILHRLFAKYPSSFAMILWFGEALRCGSGEPVFSLNLHHPAMLRDLVLSHEPVRLAEAYFDGELDVAGDFNAALGLRFYLENLRLPPLEKVLLALRVG